MPGRCGSLQHHCLPQLPGWSFSPAQVTTVVLFVSNMAIGTRIPICLRGNTRRLREGSEPKQGPTVDGAEEVMGVGH